METVVITPRIGTSTLNPVTATARRYDAGVNRVGFIVRGVMYEPGTVIVDEAKRTHTVSFATPNDVDIWYVC